MVYFSLEIPPLTAPFYIYYSVVSRPCVVELSKGSLHDALLG